MKNIFIILTLVWFGLIANAFSADFKKGFDAYEAGDYATALKEWQPLAEQGDAVAQNNLGHFYKNGLGVIQDYKEAVKWWSLAARHACVKYCSKLVTLRSTIASRRPLLARSNVEDSTLFRIAKRFSIALRGSSVVISSAIFCPAIISLNNF